MKKILWTKEYQEDFGTKDAEGFYDYAYRYYIYWFTLPNDQKIRGRQYTDNLELCSLHIALDNFEGKTDAESVMMKDSIYAIVNFLLTNQGVKRVDYFNGEYRPIDLSKVGNNLTDFVLEEVSSKG